MASAWPRTADLELQQDGNTFVTAVDGALPAYNLTAAIGTELLAARGAYETDLAAATEPSTRTKGTINQKNISKRAYLAILRTAAKLVKAGPDVTEQMKIDAGLPIPDMNPTPVGPPESFPLSTLSPQGAARNELRLADSATPTKRARPKNAVAAEVRMAVVDSPATAPANWDRTLFVTKALTEIASDESDAGKTLIVQSRWLGSKGQVGPRGPVETGTIAA